MAREISAPNILDGVVTEIGSSGNAENIAISNESRYPAIKEIGYFLMWFIYVVILAVLWVPVMIASSHVERGNSHRRI